MRSNDGIKQVNQKLSLIKLSVHVAKYAERKTINNFLKRVINSLLIKYCYDDNQIRNASSLNSLSVRTESNTKRENIPNSFLRKYASNKRDRTETSRRLVSRHL